MDAVDALSGLAPLLRVRPELEDVCRLGGDWVSPHGNAPAGWAYFHIITKGSAALDRPGFARLLLQAGDILLLPHGDTHTMRAPCRSGRVAALSTEYRGTVRLKLSIGIEPDAELICGRLHFDAVPENLVIAVLPDVVVLHIGEQPFAARFGPLVHGIKEELARERPGAAAIAKDLASALFVMMLRAHLETPGLADGLLRLLNQPATARAVLAMVHDPLRNWTLDELADVAAASRATLVRAFQKAASAAPLAFLTDLRLSLARRRLSDHDVSLEQVAAEAGYQSQAAFSRAFLRKYGIRPGRLRADAHAAQADIATQPTSDGHHRLAQL